MQALALLGCLAPIALATSAAEAAPEPLRFVLIPKVTHPWFEAVREGAEAAARMIEQQTDTTAVIEYRPPARAEAGLQASILQAAIHSKPSGITIDLLDADRLSSLLKQAQLQGIPVTVFDSELPADLGITSIGNDFCVQASIAAERLVKLLGGQGEVAIMQGVPTAPNHAIRVECHRKVFARHPGITVVASPIDGDNIATAEQMATATMRRHPRLKGWVVSDAGGGIGIGRAIQALGKTGEVRVVGLDDLPELVQLIRSGVVDSTAATKPRSQGYWSVLSLWQQGLGAPPIQRIDTGIAVQGSATNHP
ncbi:substrate-binding domain-containing protein [Synechococcus sp. CBW1006]|nr:substrate-binding domain-containing protein [Synechococcus sp. CBW1006]